MMYAALTTTQHKLALGEVRINQHSFCWDPTGIGGAKLENINIHIRPRELIAVCGTVGSGKSSLIAAILGEMNCSESGGVCVCVWWVCVYGCVCVCVCCVWGCMCVVHARTCVNERKHK